MAIFLLRIVNNFMVLYEWFLYFETLCITITLLDGLLIPLPFLNGSINIENRAFILFLFVIFLILGNIINLLAILIIQV